ncbi:MAG: site-specific integrase [Ruminiclostridium sp.]|nr:site-specific integrase [Ruminiclostridium sp.]
MASYEKRGNSYRIKSSCGYNSEGKQVFQRMTWTPDPNMTHKQIEKELNRQCVLFDEACKKGFVTSPVKFKDFAEQWFEDYANLNLRSTTLARERQLTGRVYDAIGHIRLDKLNARIIQKFINSLTAEGTNQTTGKGLSKKTMTHYLSFISKVLDYAIKMDMLGSNPCKKVTIPKGSVKERVIYSVDETERFFKIMQEAPLKYRVFFTLVTYTGMRRGEMLGLEWHDINFDTGIIHIQRTSNYTKARGIYTDDTKTKGSNRFVKVPQDMLDMLSGFRKAQQTESENVGDKWHDSDRLFVKWDGRPMNPQTPYGWLKEFCEDHDFPFHGIHQFRHLYASFLIGAGIDVATVSGSLGHNNQVTTLSIYSHMFKEFQAKACDAVVNALNFNKNEPPKNDNKTSDDSNHNKQSA